MQVKNTRHCGRHRDNMSGAPGRAGTFSLNKLAFYRWHVGCIFFYSSDALNTAWALSTITAVAIEPACHRAKQPAKQPRRIFCGPETGAGSIKSTTFKALRRSSVTMVKVGDLVVVHTSVNNIAN
jgi:hypothetical protein